ncbi:MAG: hypothetical protein RSC93_05150 [Erysipelotrichaceae bacterium]
MKTMRIEKNLRLHESVDEVLNIYVNEALSYQNEEDGMRALGSLYMKGQYRSGHEIKEFKDVLEMDVLAPSEKMAGDRFQLKIKDYEAHENGEQIKVEILFEIIGLKVVEENETIDEVIQVDRYEEEQEPILQEQVNEVIETQKQEVEHSDLEDLFEDEGNVTTTYRIVVAKKNDTYSSIASRYVVDESSLRETNRNKEVQGKTLVILPYGVEVKEVVE